MSPQGRVALAFAECMEADRRTLADIRAAARLSFRGAGREPPSDYQLQIMISRMCAGERWEYFPAYSSPPRYVSRARVEQLAAAVTAGHGAPGDADRLADMLADLEAGVRHWRAKHARARQKEEELTALIQRAVNVAFTDTLQGVLL